MAKKTKTWTLSELATTVGGTVVGNPQTQVSRPVPAGYDDPAGITFAGNETYVKKALASTVGAIIVPLEAPDLPRPLIKVADPRLAFAKVCAVMARPLPIHEGIHPTAIVSPEAHVDPTAKVGAYCVVEAGAKLGPNCRVYPFCYIGENCQVGDNGCLYPHVVLIQDIVIGKNSIIHSGVVLGADGFGFVWDGTQRLKIPQVGGITIGDNVEVGANSCIDRATSGETLIGDGVKLDNLVQIAHNVEVGRHTVMASQVGIAGSSKVGERVIFGGQAGMADHLSVADDVVLGGRSGVVSDIELAGEYFGMPPAPVNQTMRAMALQQRLPELFKRLRALERQIEELTGDKNLPPKDTQ